MQNLEVSRVELAIDFISCDCISHENRANTHPHFKADKLFIFENCGIMTRLPNCMNR